ncbi:MAG TPA: hypothetical protein VIG80_03135 [Bacillaceae bacterium]
MEKKYEARHIFMALGICVLVATPLLLFFVPQVMAKIIYASPDLWVVVPQNKSYYAYGAGFLLLALALFLVYIFEMKKVPVVLSLICLALSGASLYMASHTYKSISYHGVAYSPLFSLEDYTYSWEEVDKVIYHRKRNLKQSDYEFVFRDGSRVQFKENLYFLEVKHYVMEMLKQKNIEMETKLAGD